MSAIVFPELCKAAFEDFVVPSYETAPNTTIQNRAKVTRSLKAIAGVERIHVRSINRLQNEFGPNGEQVWEADNKDSRVRFVGGSITFVSANDGAYASFGSTSDYVEVTFYGTGLNILSVLDGNNRSMVASIDGGVEGSALFSTGSNIVSGRNYSANQIFPVIADLTLGWHTARIRRTGAVAPLVFGFEILNQRTNLAVYPGSGIAQGALNGLSSLATSSFTDGVTGTRGARVVKYVDNGTLKSAVQAVDATQKNLSLADHTNEEVVRRINFREFGANRADDLSTLALVGSNRAFTLDDGTTTLVGQNLTTATHSSGVVGVRQGNVLDFYTLTFVGTGLDVFGVGEAGSPQTGNIEVVVDGGTANIFSETISVGTQNNPHIIKICSGLPYGTHTVRFTRPSGSGVVFATSDFIIYQPKKPSIPAGALEVADYNVMASFVGNTVATVNTISQGVLRKVSNRELVYAGTWTAPSLDATFFNNGWNIRTTTSASYYEYSFYGTGADILTAYDGTDIINWTVLVNGTTPLLAGATNTIIPSSGTGLTFASSGAVTGTGTGSKLVTLRITGLPLGQHRIRVTNNSTTELYADGIDIITPIHINQPSLKIGSLSLKSATKYSPEKVISNAGPDLSKAKALVVFEGVSSVTIMRAMNISAVLRIATGEYIVYFEKPFKNSSYVVTYNAGTAQCYPSVKTANYIRFNTAQTNAVVVDTTFASMAFFGELVDE